MLNEQVAGMLRNNAGNPNIVKRIAQENDLSQTEVAQTLRIPEAAASRYMPGMTPERGMESGPIDGGAFKPAPMPTPMPTPMATKPGMQPPQVPMAGGAPSSAGSAGGGMASGQALRPGAIGGDLANPVYGGDGIAIGQPMLDSRMGMDNPRPATPMNPGAFQPPPMGQRQIIGQPGGGMRRQEPSGADIMRGGMASVSAPSLAGSAADAMTAGSAGGGMASVSAPSLAGSAANAAAPQIPVKPGSIPQMSQPMRPPAVAPGSTNELSPVGGSGFGNIPGNRPQTQTKPLPASMKPQGLVAPPPVAGFRGPARVPSAMPQPASSAVQRKAPAAPAPAAARPRAPARVPTADQAFMSGFNRIRGARA